MAIPKYDELIVPLLTVLATYPVGVPFSKVRNEVADLVGVSEEDRKELLPSGRYPVFRNRVGWAHDRLKRAGLSQSVKRGTWCLTEAGFDFVKRHGTDLDNGMIDAIARAHRDSTVAEPKAISGIDFKATPKSTKLQATASAPEHLTPRDQIEAAIKEWNESIASELLEMIASCSPSFFEKLVLDLLLAMGYGADHKSLTQTGGSGDGGIDGIITLDKLGLEKVYIQAKRYTASNVGSPEIRNFYGALAERKASKGVFITSSGFSDRALQTAKRLSDNIVLVDGTDLARFMIEHEVGCSVKQVVKVVEVDSDYFEEEG